MPRYFFHIANGKTFKDDLGELFLGIAEAMAHAAGSRIACRPRYGAPSIVVGVTPAGFRDIAPKLVRAISADARRAAGHIYTTTAASRSAPHQADARSNHRSCRRCGSDGRRHSDGNCERVAYEYRHLLHLPAPRQMQGRELGGLPFAS